MSKLPRDTFVQDHGMAMGTQKEVANTTVRSSHEVVAELLAIGAMRHLQRQKQREFRHGA